MRNTPTPISSLETVLIANNRLRNYPHSFRISVIPKKTIGIPKTIKKIINKAPLFILKP